MTTEEQIELARKFAGRFQCPEHIGKFIDTVQRSFPKDLTLLARVETLLAEADAKPAERVCEWKLDSMEWYLPTCQPGISRAHLEDLCPHCGGRVKVKEQK